MVPAVQSTEKLTRLLEESWCTGRDLNTKWSKYFDMQDLIISPVSERRQKTPLSGEKAIARPGSALNQVRIQFREGKMQTRQEPARAGGSPSFKGSRSR